MSFTNIELCSRALIRLGANPITDFDDGSAEADIANALYGATKNSLLSSYPWSFATKQVQLEESGHTPLADYSYSFTLPSDILCAVSAGVGSKGKGTHFKILNGALNSNSNNIVLTYIAEVPESDFPAFFSSILITKLAAEFSIPVTENTSRTEMLYKLSEKEIRKARQIDAQQDSPNRLENFTLIDVRG